MGKLGRNFGSLSITLLLLVFEQGVLCLESPNIFLVLDITSDNLMQGIDLVSSRSSSFHLIKSINHLRFFVHSFFVHPYFRPAVLHLMLFHSIFRLLLPFSLLELLFHPSFGL
jgi:hypothetical protein